MSLELERNGAAVVIDRYFTVPAIEGCLLGERDHAVRRERLVWISSSLRDDVFQLVGNLGKQSNGATVQLPAADYAAIDAFAAANDLTLPSVPEPASAGLLAAAGIGMLARRRRSL